MEQFLLFINLIIGLLDKIIYMNLYNNRSRFERSTNK